MTKTLLALGLLTSMLTGCVTHTVTNLTPTGQPRATNHMYRVEYQWDSTDQTVRPGTIKPVVMIGTEEYPMKSVMKMHNRWEAWIPVPPTQSEITYYYKIAYQYTGFGKVGKASTNSKEYTLTIR
jgi:hypothetical protein